MLPEVILGVDKPFVLCYNNYTKTRKERDFDMERSTATVFNGIGYQDYKEQRKKQFIAEGLPPGKIENTNEEYAEWVIYFGRACIFDFETGKFARAPLKIGRGKFVTAIQRGRNQPGVDFRIYAAIIVTDNRDTKEIENRIKEVYKDRNIPGSQGQRELYDFKDGEIKDLVNTIRTNYTSVIKKVAFYE